MQEALRQGDGGALARGAHELNSSSSTLDVRKIHQLSVELQALGKAQDLSKAASLLSQLVRVFELVHQRLIADHGTITHTRSPRT